jgi:two-component system chemotaxis response regulator CheY
MLIAISVEVADLFGTERLGPKRLRRQDGFRSVTLDGRRDHDEGDALPLRYEAHRAQEIPPIHDGHSEIEQDEAGKLGLRREPLQRLVPVAGESMHMTFARQQLRDGLSRILMIFDDENTAHVAISFGKPGENGRPTVSSHSSPHPRIRRRSGVSDRSARRFARMRPETNEMMKTRSENRRIRAESPMNGWGGSATMSKSVTGHLRPQLEGKASMDGLRKGQLVLVVEDHEDTQTCVAQQLEDYGFEVATASDGESAMRLMRERRPALVYLDMNLPNVSGYDVCEQIRTDPMLQDIPVVMTSAQTSISVRASCMEAGADAFVPKPFQLDAFAKMIGRMVSRTAGDAL